MGLPRQVITPSAGGPADKAGIQPRDAVLSIDGKPTFGTSLYDAGELLQGAEGTQVSTCKPRKGLIPCRMPWTFSKPSTAELPRESPMQL